LHPQLNSLLSRVRHTNTLVIADRGFPFWPQIETVDLALVDDIPTVLDVLRAIVPNFVIGKAWMASEFRQHNDANLLQSVTSLLPGLTFEPHEEFKQRVPSAIGLIRTGGTAQYSNVILQSA
jgi:D-ribose pyranase